MTEEEHLANQAAWTVRDEDGVDHRAVQQASGTFIWVITACPWWKTHNVSGQKAAVRSDLVPTCLECTMFEIYAIGKAKCVHCGVSADLHTGSMTHAFEAAP